VHIVCQLNICSRGAENQGKHSDYETDWGEVGGVGEDAVRGTTLITILQLGRRESGEYAALKVPRARPLILLAKVGWWQGKRLEMKKVRRWEVNC
jgi:hypothetical protein